MKKLLVAALIGIGAWLAFKAGRGADAPPAPAATTTVKSSGPSASSATFTIDNEPITLSRGSYTSAAGDISLLSETASGDLNGDSKADSAVLLADNSAGSGVFIYIAAYVSGPVTYKGTNAIFVGDRISPESVSIGSGVVTLTYLDRKPGEPFSAEPTVPVTKQFVYQNGEFVEK